MGSVDGKASIITELPQKDDGLACVHTQSRRQIRSLDHEIEMPSCRHSCLYERNALSDIPALNILLASGQLMKGGLISSRSV